MINKKSFSERDVCSKFISPALKNAGWDLNKQVLEEVAYTRVVAVAQDGFVLEMSLVIGQFLLDVGELGIELVLLGRPSGVQASI